MTFAEAVSDGFKQYATFEGRASRSAFWFWTLFGALAFAAAATIDAVVGSFGVVIALTSLATFLPSLAVEVRRLHDVGKSGWTILWGFVPFGSLYVLYLLVQPTQTAVNQYGMPESQALAPSMP